MRLADGVYQKRDWAPAIAPLSVRAKNALSRLGVDLYTATTDDVRAGIGLALSCDIRGCGETTRMELRHWQKVLAEPQTTRAFTIRICNDCYALTGEMCHEPDCVFCRRTMAEVGGALDMLLIRPVVDGNRLDLHPLEADASPAKDPIAAAVDAQLDPLKAELIDIGHKLAKETR